MEKTIKIGDKKVTLCNDIVWALNYRDQFGQDIIPTLMPMIAAGIDLVSGFLKAGAVGDKIYADEVLKHMDGDDIMNAVIHLGGVELTDLINITWALAKTADEDIPEPREWAKELGAFPVDEVAPAVFDMIMKGTVSSKNLKRLEGLKKKLKAVQPKQSSSTTSSSEPLSEA